MVNWKSYSDLKNGRK